MDFKEEILRSLEVGEKVIVPKPYTTREGSIEVIKIGDGSTKMNVSYCGLHYSVLYRNLTCESFEVYKKLTGEKAFDYADYPNYLKDGIKPVKEFYYLNKDDQQQNNGIIITGQGA